MRTTDKCLDVKKFEISMDALLFIDTNIFLDFYRVRGGGEGLSLLQRVEEHHDRIITGDQVEMEYNRTYALTAA
jgi:hypothetical protein